MLLPIVLIFMLRLINKHDLMGKYTNSRFFNAVAWLTAASRNGPVSHVDCGVDSLTCPSINTPRNLLKK